MSGIVGIVNLDGAPVDPGLLSSMTGFLDSRGPDDGGVWIEGQAGFGFTLLKTTDEAESGRQPFTLDGKVWIVADARVDARQDLIAALGSGGGEIAPGATDVELILRAYTVWGESCVEHLLGDFAFGIWDGPRRRLFCARDHMGVKPFYYAHLGATVIFSNTLDCIRLHPAVSARLNDLAVADFLLFDMNQDKATTTFADIQRIPPGHSISWSTNGAQLRRYWTLPIDEPVYYRRADDYIDRFHELLRAAVGDRLRTDRLSIFMSGGLDSPTLAASACGVLRDRTGYAAVRAFTTSYEGYDHERYYAGLVAEKLDISISFQDWSDELADPNWTETRFHTPEPERFANALAASRAYHQRIASHSRVTFFGEGADNALNYEWQPYFSHLILRKRYAQILADIGNHAILHRRVPLPNILRTLGRRTPAKTFNPALFPLWLNPELAKRFELRARWEHYQTRQPSPHPVRPKAYASFDSPIWQLMLEKWDAANTGSLMEVRHPFLDLRLLRYFLAMPMVPWCRTKYLIRRAMRGRLPEPVLRRPKTTVFPDRWGEQVERIGMPPLDPAPELRSYVDPDLACVDAVGPGKTFWVNFRTRALNYWLRNRNQIEQNSRDFPVASGL